MTWAAEWRMRSRSFTGETSRKECGPSPSGSGTRGRHVVPPSFGACAPRSLVGYRRPAGPAWQTLGGSARGWFSPRAARRGSQPVAPPLWIVVARLLVPRPPVFGLRRSLCQLADRVDKRSDAGDRDLDLVALLQRVLALGDHACAGADDRAVADRVVAGQELDQLRERAADPGGVDRAVEDRPTVAQYPAAQVEVHAR